MDKKRGLGKGIDALFTSAPARPGTATTEIAKPVISTMISGRTIVFIGVEKIIANRNQPRQHFNQEKLQELADSISQYGVAEPIIVRPAEGDLFELIAGERRWRASKLAGLKEVPAIIKSYSDEQSLELALIENIQREDLSPIEEADAYVSLAKGFGMTQEEIAKKVGKSRPAVANTIRLLELPGEIKSSLINEEITAGHARALLSITDNEERMKTWRSIIQSNVTVREVENLVADQKAKKAKNVEKKLPLELADIEDKLTSYFGTKVKIVGRPDKGKIEINYFSREDIERLIEIFLKEA